jgi:hypothetical protein
MYTSIAWFLTTLSQLEYVEIIMKDQQEYIQVTDVANLNTA